MRNGGAHLKGFLDYIPGDSLLHRLSPITKLLLSFIICAAVFISQSCIFILFVIIIVTASAFASGIGTHASRLLLGLFKLGLILFLLQIFFIGDGKVLLTLPLNIKITDRGVMFSLLIALRLTASALPLALVLSVTKMSDLSGSLIRKLGIPYKYAFAFTTAIRFIPIFSHEMSEIVEAQTARGVELDTKNFLKKIGLLLPLCVPLLISSVRKTEYIALSAELRGFSLRTRKSGYKEYKMALCDYCALALGVILTVCAAVVNLP